MKSYRIPSIARKYTDYDMIQTYTDLPALAHPRLRLLHAFLVRGQAYEKHSELYTLVASLVQLGMDTHDRINNDADEPRRAEKEMRSKQLKVLAGDYFSSIFYQLLAQAGQIEMIAILSEAVCEVNRMKTNLYMRMKQMKLTADDYLSYMTQLRSELFQSFTAILDATLSRIWQELLTAVTRCEVILEEIERSADARKFLHSWAYWHVMQDGTEEERDWLSEMPVDQAKVQGLVDKYGIRGKLVAKLNAAAELVKAITAKLDTASMLDEPIRIVDDMLNRAAGRTPALHETR
ncbi:heptaprenyl diphosphate synthase component 1 [Paenibacillus harenae]|uniref:heptaprenyl diphosphate synthase component 1 n=1 Tax=Paenibacillus harenae TaxID=306543 RepID=UPI002790ED57|nr:heptaprenyl diphosphate synthase component 1 [Paenibacillus harenae]MDQ0058196.1 heptaprenyl diphosphate synthase [Paenibacillus harenae]